MQAKRVQRGVALPVAEQFRWITRATQLVGYRYFYRLRICEYRCGTDLYRIPFTFTFIFIFIFVIRR